MCIAAADQDAAVEVVGLMAAVGLQPEREQEKRMIAACLTPNPNPSSRSQGRDHSEEEEEQLRALEEERLRG